MDFASVDVSPKRSQNGPPLENWGSHLGSKRILLRLMWAPKGHQVGRLLGNRAPFGSSVCPKQGASEELGCHWRPFGFQKITPNGAPGEIPHESENRALVRAKPSLTTFRDAQKSSQKALWKTPRKIKLFFNENYENLLKMRSQGVPQNERWRVPESLFSQPSIPCGTK